MQSQKVSTEKTTYASAAASETKNVSPQQTALHSCGLIEEQTGHWIGCACPNKGGRRCQGKMGRSREGDKGEGLKSNLKDPTRDRVKRLNMTSND